MQFVDPLKTSLCLGGHVWLFANCCNLSKLNSFCLGLVKIIQLNKIEKLIVVILAFIVQLVDKKNLTKFEK